MQIIYFGSVESDSDDVQIPMKRVNENEPQLEDKPIKKYAFTYRIKIIMFALEIALNKLSTSELEETS